MDTIETGFIATLIIGIVLITVAADSDGSVFWLAGSVLVAAGAIGYYLSNQN